MPASASLGGPSTVIRQALLRVREVTGGVAGEGVARRGVLLLLPAWCVDLVLRAAAALEDEGLWSPEDVTFVSLGAEEAVLAHSRQTLGGLVLRARAGGVAEFERHFRSLTLDNNQRNPWFPEFWSSVFHCRGSACRTGPHHGLDAYQMQQVTGCLQLV